MEIRNIAGSLKQWCVKKGRSIRKELQEIHIACSTNLQPDLSLTRSKSNFIMNNINICKGCHEFYSLNSII